MTDEPIKAPETSAPKVEAVSAKSAAPVLLKGEIKIFPDKPMPQYDRGVIRAFEAVGGGGVPAFALLCQKNVVPQSEIVHKYAGIVTSHLPKLLGCGVVEWSVDKKEYFVFVYENKLGSPITEGKNPAALGLKPDLVIATIFRNLLEVIRAMRDKGIAHGNICVQNLYDGGTPNFESTILGEMLSAPSGFNQPILYETISRSLCLPLGKGAAELSDDIYALGITLATLIRTQDPAEGMHPEEIIINKMEQGSFNFIVGKSRFPAPILEFLRGTLNDDEHLRWTFDDIMTWAEGQRVSAKQATGAVTLKASRPIDFLRKKFLKPQVLAVNLGKEPVQVVSMIENGELSLWINRSLQDKELEKRYDEALTDARIDVGSTNFPDRLSTFMAIALAPGAPVLYKDIKFLPVGFGALIADAAATKKDIGPFIDMLQTSIIMFWSKCSLSQSAGVGEAINKISTCRTFLMQSIIGSGLERCIYYLSPMAPCFSEKLEGFYVRSSEDFLNALEKISERRNRPEWFLDRHIVAFLSVRDKSIIEPFLPDIASTEVHRQRQGAIKMMAAIQARDKMRDLPGISAWVSGMLEAPINRFHDREKRKKIREQLERLKDKGDLKKIAAFFDNYEDIQNDAKSFSDMMKYYQALKNEHAILEDQLLNNKNFGIEAGRQTAAFVSGIISAAVVVLYLAIAISQGGLRLFS